LIISGSMAFCDITRAAPTHSRLAKLTAIAFLVNDFDRLDPGQRLGPQSVLCIHRSWPIRPHRQHLWLHWRPYEQKEIWVGMEQMDAEVVETVAGVARLLRRAAELAWTRADAAGPRSSHQLLALGIDSAADEASGLLPRRARLDGPTPFGDNPADLLASADQLLRRICVVGAPSRLLGLRALVAELVWEANTGAGT
jgi:hypothetical protein